MIMSQLRPPEPPPLADGHRYGFFTRAVQQLGHVQAFTVVIRYAGSKLDRVLYRASGGRITLTGPSLPTMLLTTRGRRTGQPRTVQVFYVRDGHNLVAACENFGLAAPASWPGNLRADPRVTIRIGSGVARYRARPATEQEIERAMPRLLSVWPAHDTYLRRTGIRYVFVFEPVPDVAEPR
jgi:deazaflavin-dependent oxidoreductase (nitroreductase family)